MEVDNKPLIDKAKVKDLIKEAVSKETAALKRELNKLRSAKRSSSPHPKAKRGQCQGALSKEKKSNNNKNNQTTSNKKTNKKTNRSKSNNGKANAAANDSNKNGGPVRNSSYPNSQRRIRSNKNNGKCTNSRQHQRN